MVSRQRTSPQQVSEGTSKDAPLRRLQGQQGRPPLAPTREKRTRAQLRLRRTPIREPDAPTSSARRRSNARPPPQHSYQPPTTESATGRREPPSALRPITTTTTNHVNPSPDGGNPK